jgi:hypothetical protein
MKTLWKLCLGVVVGGLAGQMVTAEDWILGNIKCEMVLERNSYGLYWNPDTAGYPITLSADIINAEGEAWRAVVGGSYTFMRPDGSFTALDKKGVLLQSGTWFMIENFQITDHPYQTEKAKPTPIHIVYYNFQGNDGKMKTFYTYYTLNSGDFGSKIGASPRNCYIRTKFPIE